MDIMAQRYKVSKNDILESNAGGKSAAVKVALGETQIVKETKEFLEENGVKLEAFNAVRDFIEIESSFSTMSLEW